MTIEELNNFYYLNEEVKKLKDRIEELTELSASNYENEIRGGGEVSDSVSKYVMKRLELLEVLNEIVEKRDTEEIKIRKFINGIESAEMRMIVELRVMYKKTWDEIAKELSPKGRYMDGSTFRKKFTKFIHNSYNS